MPDFGSQRRHYQIIFGQIASSKKLLSRYLPGHVLLIGVPGLGKTKLVESLGKIIGLEERRVQFTPDLMPADILGSEVLEEFDKARGPFGSLKAQFFASCLWPMKLTARVQEPSRPFSRRCRKAASHSWSVSQPAEPVPCPGNAKPAEQRVPTVARGTARPLSHAD